MILRKKNGNKSKSKEPQSSDLPLEMLLRKDKKKLIDHLRYIKQWKKNVQKEIKEIEKLKAKSL